MLSKTCNLNLVCPLTYSGSKMYPNLRWPQSTLSLLRTTFSLLRTTFSLLCTTFSLLRTQSSLLHTRVLFFAHVERGPGSKHRPWSSFHEAHHGNVVTGLGPGSSHWYSTIATGILSQGAHAFLKIDFKTFLRPI